MQITNVNTCVYVEWYKFNICTIKTCKNYTSITKTHCLAIDRTQPSGSKVITDAELHMYKFPGNRISTRLVSMKRKKAISRVRSVLVLNSYLEFLYEKYKDTVQPKVSNKQTEKLQRSFPLRIRRLKFENWMWPHMVNPDEYREFVSHNDGECSLLSLQDLLQMTDLKFRALAQSLNPKGELHG